MIKKKWVENLERLQRQWQRRGNGRLEAGPIEGVIIFMKQIDKEKIGRESRETTEAVAETDAEKMQWKAGGWSL